MKKIINAFSFIAIIVGVVLGATGAYFTDTETSPTNVFAAGTLDLTTDGPNTTLPIQVTNIKPGDFDSGVIRLKNAGTITGDIIAATINKTDDKENNCNSPEALIDTTCGNPGTGEGELDDYLKLTVWIDTDGNGVLDGTETYFVSSSQSLILLNGVISQPSSEVSLSADQTADIKVKWEADPAHLGGNIFQSDSTGFSITFDFKQK
ncbi:MAG: TasA family protein [Candidatus Paceibacterota bacterium]|jgi:predicted ribosomally synthesized peptide with SipW-like signal peptide